MDFDRPALGGTGGKCMWFVAERGMWADGGVVTAPAFDDDLSFPQRVKDLAIEQFVTQATSLTPIWRIASAMPWRCETTKTSTCRNWCGFAQVLVTTKPNFVCQCRVTKPLRRLCNKASLFLVKLNTARTLNSVRSLRWGLLDGASLINTNLASFSCYAERPLWD